MSFLLALLAAIIVFCGYLLIDNHMAEKKRRESLRARIAPDGTTLTDADGPLNLSGEMSPGAARMLGLLRGLGVNTDVSRRKLERRFAHAGINSPDAPVYYLFFQRFGALALLILALVLFFNHDEQTAFLSKTLAAFLAVIALFGPHLYLQNLIDRRKKTLQRAFPDTLDLLLICVESGLALDASLNRVCTELGFAYPEMTAELNRTRLELALLNDRVRALMNLGERTDMVAFRSLISSLIQSERFGTSLTDTLRVLSEDFRLLRLADAEAKAARLPVLMTIPLIFLLMPAFFMIVMGPAIVKFVNDGQQVTGK